MRHFFRGAKQLPDGTLVMDLHTRLLEDKSTLFIIQVIDKDTEDIPPSPLAELVSIFAIQPRRDMKTAAETLSHVTHQPGVELIREVFPWPTKPKSKSKSRLEEEEAHTCLMLLVRVSVLFRVPSERFIPAYLQQAQEKFSKRRSATHTMLQGTGCRVTLIEGKKLIKVHFHGVRHDDGTTVFKGQRGFVSKQIEPFLRIKGVHTRHIHNFDVPDLEVVHRVGAHVLNLAQPVGFSHLTTGTVLVCGSTNTEVLSVFQQLTDSLATRGQTRQIFVIDTYGELNGLINHFQAHPPTNLNLQLFRLGTNIHLNLCDVIIPIVTNGDQSNVKARAAWKSHLVSQIILSSMHTSEYLTARYSVPLEGQIKKTAEDLSTFTFKDVKLDIGGSDEGDVQVNREGIDMMFADMMAIEALAGVLEQFRSFPEVNYGAFTGHYSNTLVRSGTLTFFQFGAQPPLIRRATIAFLLHYLSQTMKHGCVVLTHAAEFLSRRTTQGRQREIVASVVVDACNTIARHNTMLLGSQSLQALESNMDTFEEVANCIYLKMTNAHDREIVITRHELDLDVTAKRKDYRPPLRTQQQFLGIEKGEGLLFREDGPQNGAYHFKLDKLHPVDLEPVYIPTTKQRGSETLGLTPPRYEILMRFLKLLMAHPRRMDEVMAVVEQGKQGELSIDQLQSLGMFKTDIQEGATYWVITKRGREYYRSQLDFIATLPAPLMRDKVHEVSNNLKRLENFYDISSSVEDRKETNTKVKALVGGLLNYVCHLSPSVPWLRIAKYHDLRMIDSLEWQDFRHLFDLAHAMVNNLFLDIRQLQQQRSSEEVEQKLQASSVPSRPERKDLDDFLPDDRMVRLQQLSEELGLEPYPKTGILDLYYTLHTQQRSLLDELKVKKEEE